MRKFPFDRGFEVLTYTIEGFELTEKKSIVVRDVSEYCVKIA